jgi:hypothetical protein
MMGVWCNMFDCLHYDDHKCKVDAEVRIFKIYERSWWECSEM